MTCKRCRHEFCWYGLENFLLISCPVGTNFSPPSRLCLAAQADIRKEGNTAHAKTCKYHSHNLDIAWPFNAH